MATTFDTPSTCEPADAAGGRRVEQRSPDPALTGLLWALAVGNVRIPMCP